jgi:hypothetical protein
MKKEIQAMTAACWSALVYYISYDFLYNLEIISVIQQRNISSSDMMQDTVRGIA